MGAYDDVQIDEGAISDNSMVTEEVQEEDPQIGNGPQQEATPTDGQPVPAEGQQPQPQWNGEEWSLKYKGRPYVPKSRDELVSLAQKGFSYAQQMEQINRERQEYQRHLQDMQSRYSHYDEFDKALRSNPALAERIMQVAQEWQNQPGGSAGSGDVNQRLYGELMNKIQTLESQNSERINSEYDRKLEETLANIKKQYPDHDWEYDDGVSGNLEKQLLQFAYDNGITNLDYAYRAMMWDQRGTSAKADALKQQAAAKQQATRAGVIQKTSTAGLKPTRPGYKYGDSYSDLAKRMAEEIKT